MKLFAFMALAASCFGQARVAPFKMAQLRMLTGEWKALGKDGMVEFHYEMGRGMIGRAKSDNGGQWRRFIVIHPEGSDVRADFYAKAGVIHYWLETADGRTLRFVEDSRPAATQRKIVYEKEGPDRLSYRFETGSKVTDSGTLAMIAEVRPLSE